ncbi:MAG TPA: DUF3467 domain-containing protein [Chthonomonadales bacterium]|nr:DUF3467 domain-containing protein [Chthonomonadales bacterium]
MELENTADIPEFYTDSVNFMTNIYGFTLEFGAMQAQDAPPRPLCRVKMSPQHAKIMSLLLRKNVQEYEKRIGTVILPDGLYQDLGIEDDIVE